MPQLSQIKEIEEHHQSVSNAVGVDMILSNCFSLCIFRQAFIIQQKHIHQTQYTCQPSGLPASPLSTR